MIKLLLIRHGMTYGNTLGRYIGRKTDEPLSEEGRRLLHRFEGEQPQKLFVSPMRRCKETAQILFPEQDLICIEELAECDFGEFENKNYIELSGNANYQKWIDSNGTIPFPGGESREAFRDRNLKGLSELMEYCITQKIQTAAAVVHGGTIMNIMDFLIGSEESFYQWHVKNGQGYLLEIEEEEWKKSKKGVAFYSNV